MSIEKEITELVANIIEQNPDTLNPEAHFIEDLGLDSLRALEILAAIENKYSITIDPERLQEMINVNNVIKVAKEYLPATEVVV